MEKGKLIVVEGACDGIGKTTQFDMLCRHLSDDGEMIASHHFPTYHTYHGMPVEKYLSGEYGKVGELSPYFINSLYAIDRGVTWYSELKALHEQGINILLDRYTTSSIIYQAALIDDMAERKKFIDYITDFEYNKIGTKEPDNVIFLYAPFELVSEIRKARKGNDGIENDVHESNLEYMKKVYDNAMFVADYLDWDKVKCDDGNQMRPIDDIHEEIYSLVKRKK